MFEKISQSAEKVVSKVSVSRRGFLGRAAKVAAGVGVTLAGLGRLTHRDRAGIEENEQGAGIEESSALWVPGRPEALLHLRR